MSPLPSPWICTAAAPPLIVSGPPAAPLIVLTATVPTMLSVPADPTRIAISQRVPSIYVLPDRQPPNRRARHRPWSGRCRR